MIFFTHIPKAGGSTLRQYFLTLLVAITYVKCGALTLVLMLM